MDLTKYPIIIIVVVAAIVVWLMTKLWYDKQKKEGFDYDAVEREGHPFALTRMWGVFCL